MASKKLKLALIQMRVKGGDEWREAYIPVAKEFSTAIFGVSNVGDITDGPWKGRSCIGCSLASDSLGEEILQGSYGVDAECILYVDVEPAPRPARGTGWKKWLAMLFMTAQPFFGDALAREQTITNPIAPNGADPWLVKENGIYHYCYSRGGSIWINTDKTLQGAAQFEGRKIWTPPPGKPWSKELWAPELHFLKGKWYIYVATDNGDNANHRMYVLESKTDDPMGDYVFRGKISDASDKWAIDGTVLKQAGKLYFIWSGWEGDVNVQQNLYIAPMSDPKTISGPRVQISQPEHDWERIGEPFINEGPQILKNNGQTFVIYSASGSWTDHYCLGQLRLTGDDPLDPKSWIKSRTPVFGSTGTVFSPGHASFTKSPDGKEDWIIYHTAKHRGAGWNRDVNLKKFTWGTDGNPAFGYPESKGVPIPAPSSRYVVPPSGGSAD